MFTITPSQKQHITDIATHYQLTLLFVFGSMARGDNTVASDIDLAYSVLTPLSAQQQYALQQELQHILHMSQQIDLVYLANTTPLLAYQIMRDGQVLFAQPQAEDRFYQRTIKNYIDAQPLFEATKQYVQAYAHL